MALPSNGGITNIAPEGYFVDYSSTGNPIIQLDKPALGFRENDFMAALPGQTYVVGAVSANALFDAVANAEANGGGIIQLPGGTFDLSQKLYLPSNVIFQGAGRGVTILRATGAQDHFIEATYQENVALRDLTVDGNNGARIGINFRKGRNYLWERLEVTNTTGPNTKIYYSGRFTVRYMYSHDCVNLHGIGTKDYFPPSDGGSAADAIADAGELGLGSLWSNDFAIYSCHMYDNGDYGIDSHSENGEIAGNFIDGNVWGSKWPDALHAWFHHNRVRGGKYGVRFYRSHNVTGREMTDIWVYANKFESVETGFDVRDGAIVFATENQFKNCGTNVVISGGSLYTARGSLESSFAGVVIDDAMAATLAALRGTSTPDPPAPTPAGAPYESSAAITNLAWAPLAEIVRLESGSDTWPSTWADDDYLYTSGADGNAPGSGTKVSAWFGKASGDPPNVTITGITSSDTVPLGSGASGKKASGMLSVGGVLYMWMRNANGSGQQCQLWSSSDKGINWSQHFTFSQFGYCSFVNYGKDYAGAPDAYVYVITPNANSAYDSADDFVLLRAPKTQVTLQSAYQAYAGTSANGDPIWSTDLNARVSIFNDPGRCLRHGCTYNAGLGRYLLWAGHYTGNARFEGGFGVYEAPELWGPWRTVYFTDAWDAGPGETASFPTKYISADGKTVWLLHSGDDAFSLRKATLTASVAVDVPVDTEGILEQLCDSDAEELSEGETRIASADLDLGDPEVAAWVGARWASVAIPQYAQIITAHIRFTATGASSDTSTLTIYGQNSAAGADFVVGLDDISGRAQTSASVVWAGVGPWVDGGEYSTPNLGPIIQEIVNRGDWSSGSPLVLMITGTGKRRAWSISGSFSRAPVLYVEYAADPVIYAKVKRVPVVTNRAVVLLDDEVIVLAGVKRVPVVALPASLGTDVIVQAAVKQVPVVVNQAVVTISDGLDPFVLVDGVASGGAIVEEA